MIIGRVIGIIETIAARGAARAICGAAFISILLAVGTAPRARAASEIHENYVREIRRLARKDDILGVRVVARQYAQLKPPMKWWLEVRDVLHSKSIFGFDLIREWEKASPDRRLSEIDRLIAQGQSLASKKQFQAAFDKFQRAAQMIKVSSLKTSGRNSELYMMTLHLMGRALYGAARFNEAHTVLAWLPPTYSGYRQTLFERMWAAFRAGRMNQAVGALGSQHSSYLGSYLEPEAYLVEIYIYRKMCRDEDLQTAIRGVQAFKKLISDGRYSIKDWLRSDFQTKAFVEMMEQTHNPSSPLVDEIARDEERTRITAVLEKKFAIDRRRLVLELDRVLAFAVMAFSSSSKELPKIEKLPLNEELLRSGREMWPLDDAEDWLDELGRHVFIGESQCTSSPPRSP